MGTSRKERPLCLGASGSVRHNAKHQSDHSDQEVHTFWPSITQSSPSRRARVWTLARSLPAFGSEYPWHQSSSPRAMGGRKRCFWASVPKAMTVGPSRVSPMCPIRPGPPARAYSSWKMTCWARLAPRPP
jgi:hypothetical protein